MPRNLRRPWAERFGLDIHTDDRLIEPTNKFEGKKFEFGPQVLTKPESWPWITNPFKPSWGEPFVSIAARMLAVIEAAWTDTEEGDVALVSHQLPIWMVHRTLTGQKLYHDPAPSALHPVEHHHARTQRRTIR